MDRSDEFKKDIRKRVRKLIKKGVISNLGLQKRLRQQGYKTTRRYVKQIKDEFAQELLKPKAKVREAQVLLPFPVVKRLLYPAIKKIEKKEPENKNPFIWFTEPCPRCRRCFPIQSSSRNQGVICAQCGFEYRRTIGKREGTWIPLRPVSEQVGRTNIKWTW